MNLADVYRASDINRWQVVKTIKNQSVAEHSFNVAMIADVLNARITNKSILSPKVIVYALYHDIPEIYTGDIVTPIKEHIKNKCKENFFEDFEEELCGPKYSKIKNDACIYFPEVAAIVKLADLIESVKFLEQNALTDHGEQIGRKIIIKISDKIEEYKKNWPDYDWDQANSVFEEIMNGFESDLSDLI